MTCDRWVRFSIQKPTQTQAATPVIATNKYARPESSPLSIPRNRALPSNTTSGAPPATDADKVIEGYHYSVCEACKGSVKGGADPVLFCTACPGAYHKRCLGYKELADGEERWHCAKCM